MIRKTYLFLRSISIFLIAISLTLGYLLTNEKLIPYLGKKYLKEFGVAYTKVEGTLLRGAVISELQYKDALHIKMLKIDYNFFMLLRASPKINKIQADGIFFDNNKFSSSDSNSTQRVIPSFDISELELKNTEIIIEKQRLIFDLKSSNIHYDTALDIEKLALKNTKLEVDKEIFTFELESSNLHYATALDVEKLALSFKSSYANAKIEGSVATEKFKGDASIEIDSNLSKKYLAFLKGFPKVLDLKVDATLQRVDATTQIKSISLSSDDNLSIKKMDVGLSYFTNENYFSAKANYLLSYMGIEATVKESALFDTQGAYTTKLNAELTKKTMNLPFKNFQVEVSGDSHAMVADATAQNLKLNLFSSDYANFTLHTQGKNVSLSFLENLPDVLRKDAITFVGNATLATSPFSLSGLLKSEGLYSKAEMTFEMNKKSALYQMKMVPKQKSALFKAYNLKNFLPISLVMYDDYSSQIANLDANLLNVTLFKSDKILEGWGNLSSSNFDIAGNFEKDTTLTLDAKVSSLKTLLRDLNLVEVNKNNFYDGAIDINTTLTLSKKINVKTNIHMPWYIVKLDSQTTYSGKELFLEARSTDKEITINEYSFEFMNQKVYSKKPSKLFLDADNKIHFKEFWIYDNLLLSGEINPQMMYGRMNLKSSSFTYKGKEGEVKVKADITASFDADAKQTIEGSITLLDGVINYETRTDYTVLDSDIIIIQDMKSKKKSNRYVNIRIDSVKPIAYKAKEIDLLFTPNITLYQEPNTEFKIFGMITINEGKVSGGDKTFEFDKSEIYFYGANPINPYLNLNMQYHTMNDVDIQIYVTNTLNAPVLIFASKPALSQNDIMSYILFGEPANSVFEGTNEENKLSVSSLLLGTGLKKVFSKTTGVKIDTLNILTNKEGTLGYEIGSRFNKKIRVVYKNNTVSSVIVQYSLNRSIRVDVDVQENQQGVSIIYIKDF